MILGDFLKAIGQLGDPRFLRVLLIGLGLTVALLFGAYAGFFWLAGWLAPDQITIPFIGQITWLDSLFSWGSLLLMIVLSVFLMVPVASAMTSLFLDDVADAVEHAHYPGLPDVARVPFTDAIRDTLSFLGLVIVANIVALVIYLAILPLAPVVFIALNGFLLGREYFQLVAMRRLGRQGARRMASRYRGQIWMAGMLMALPLSIPLLNLIIPILGAATFTHLFHRLQAGSSG